MNTLILTRGVPGCGKSTWIDIMGFRPYTICPDDIRLMYCAPEMKTNGTFCISQKADKYVWEFVFKVLEQRMKLGCFTVIDATHIKESAINAYKKLCEKYNYDCYIKDFSDVTLEMCIERNKNRWPYYKGVPEDVIKRMYENLLKSKIPYWCKMYKGDPIDDYFQIDGDEYKEVFIFGDIHGCYNPLEKFFKDNPYSKDNLYIFVGDYLDRGIQNKEVLEFIIGHTDDDNFVFLEGNHEKWLDFYSKGFHNDIKSNQFMEHTLNEIKDIAVDSIKHFVNNLKVYVRLNYCGNPYFITHGGIPEVDDIVYSKQLISGVGSYDESEIVDNHWSSINDGGLIVKAYSVHGHRNLHHVPMHNTKYTYNLCDKVEKGGYLRVLNLTKNGNKELMYKNDVYDKKYDMEETK